MDTVTTVALRDINHAINRIQRALPLWVYERSRKAGEDAARDIAEAMCDLGELRAALVAELTEVK